MARENIQNSTSPISDVFSDDHAVAHSDGPPSPLSVISHEIQNQVEEHRRSSIGSRRSSPIRTPSRRSLTSASDRRISGVQRSPSRNLSSETPSNGPNRHTNEYYDNKHPGPRRVNSDASSFPLPRAQSPYHGATGPSQPYQMYPQVTRSSTIDTNSGEPYRQSRRSLQASAGPTQPYALYPQNTVPDEETPTSHQQTIPLGFPGHDQGHTYRRQLGPEGEEAGDMIGPLGHTEPLPPYTRYPNDVPPKASELSTFQGVPPPQNPPQHSQDSIDVAPSNQSTERELTSSDSPTLVDPNGTPPSEVPDNDGHFKEKIEDQRKKRICGVRVPLWLLLVVIFMLVIAVVLGGVLGNRARNQDPPDQSRRPPPPPIATVFATVTSTTLIDAVPITSTPSDLPPLPTGAYTLDLENADTSSSDCLLESPDQLVAWACSEDAKLKLEVVASDAGYQISVQDQISYGAPPRYGPQTPQLSGPTLSRLMNDKGDWDKGPAYFFQRKFDKVVILREEAFDNAQARRKRGWRHDWGDDMELSQRRTNDVMQTGDKPWYCYWNQTIVEGFLYINKTASEGGDAADDPTTTKSSIYAATAFPTLPSNQPAPSSSYGSMRRKKRDQVLNSSYSKVVKIEEIRREGSPQPYCQQFQMLYNGGRGIVNLPDSQEPAIIRLNEVEPVEQKGVHDWKRAFQLGYHIVRKGLVGDSDQGSRGCQCQWVVG